MSLPVTKLDNIDFDALVEEARGLIPRYASEWTDHNAHDPGITLIEMLAWIADQEIFRIGFVGERYHRAFAALLGEIPKRALAARGLLWPPGHKRESERPEGGGPAPIADAIPAMVLRKGTRIANVEQPDLAFLLERAVFLSPARPRDPHAIDGGRSMNLAGLITSEGTRYPVSGKLGGGMTRIELPFDRPLVPDGVPEQTVSLGIGVEPFIGAADNKAKTWGPVVFEYRVGADDWQRLRVEYDGTLALARTGVVLLRVPPKAGDSSMLRLRLDRGFFPIAPKFRKLAINVLPVVQLAEIAEGELGRSNGLPDQTFALDLSRLPQPNEADDPHGVEIKPLQITVDRDAWTDAEDFRDSEPDDHHYVVDIRRKRIRFGNGVNGAIPLRNAQVWHKAFHITHGADGNLGSGRKWRIAGVPPAFTNPEPIAGGHAAMTPGDLLAAARDRVIKRDALLTNDDLRSAAERLPGFAVKRAEVVVRHDPSFPADEIRGARSLIVVAARDAASSPAQSLPRGYLDAVRQALASGRVLGERLSVLGPDYTNVDVELRLFVGVGAYSEGVCEMVESVIRARLSDLRRDPSIPPWQLARPVTRREIEALAANVPGVFAVRQCRLARTGQALAEQDIQLAATAIAIANLVDVKAAPEPVGNA